MQKALVFLLTKQFFFLVVKQKIEITMIPNII